MEAAPPKKKNFHLNICFDLSKIAIGSLTEGIELGLALQKPDTVTVIELPLCYMTAQIHRLRKANKNKSDKTILPYLSHPVNSSHSHKSITLHLEQFILEQYHITLPIKIQNCKMQWT